MTVFIPKTENRFLVGLGKGRWASLLLAFYFVGMILSGIEGLLTRPASAQPEITDSVWATLSYSLIATGSAGLAASVFRSRMGEFYAVIGISCLTVINAVIIWQANPQTSLRLLFAPCMMVPYAWMRLGFNMSRNDITAISQVITAERDVHINQVLSVQEDGADREP